jgi:hypothetical protein
MVAATGVGDAAHVVTAGVAAAANARGRSSCEGGWGGAGGRE